MKIAIQNVQDTALIFTRPKKNISQKNLGAKLGLLAFWPQFLIQYRSTAICFYEKEASSKVSQIVNESAFLTQSNQSHLYQQNMEKIKSIIENCPDKDDYLIMQYVHYLMVSYLKCPVQKSSFCTDLCKFLSNINSNTLYFSEIAWTFQKTSSWSCWRTSFS